MAFPHWQRAFPVSLFASASASECVLALLNAPSLSRKVAIAISLSSLVFEISLFKSSTANSNDLPG